jgi:hypothetical protein
MWSDRFFEIPVTISYINDTHDIIEDQYKDSIEMINPLEVSSFRPETFQEGDQPGAATGIYMKNGRVILTRMSFNDFQKRVNEHMDAQSRR